ncbi:AAA family ATPase [Vibrio astriarenae]
MRSIRIRNLRSFVDTEEDLNDFVDISPITVFVGKNSCGKSTLLRTFPLLKQSIASDTTGPILWYGDFVDFGSFSQAISNKKSNDKIYFDIKTQINSGARSFYFDDIDDGLSITHHTKGSEKIDVTLNLGVIESKSLSSTDRITIDIEGIKIKLIFSKSDLKEILLNNNPTEINTSTFRTFSHRGLLPRVIDKSNEAIFFGSYDYATINAHVEKTAKLIKKCFHNRTDINKIRQGLDRIGICKRDQFIPRLKRVFNRQTAFIKNIEDNKKYIIDEIYPNFLLSLTPEIINRLNSTILREVNRTKYIAPLRATAERYYRHQDLHVNEIDHKGSNLAIFLSRLNKSQRHSFQAWTGENFGFTVHAGDTSLHHEIKVKINDDDEEYNISDMGFGFSQILPIVASIWNETQERPSVRSSSEYITFVIEQPELHLHPQFQNLLAKAFAKVISITKNNKTKIRILFETHSNVMVDALGEAISDGIIDKENVNIVIFNKKNGITRTKVATFDEDGYLSNWPIGFFSGH